jgi:D-sedoheptulose 7-phosphate isomerase
LVEARPVADNRRGNMEEGALRARVDESLRLKERFFSTSGALVVEVGRRMAEALRGGGKVLSFGNGGSAADAQHLAAELLGRFQRDRAAWPALALTTDPSTVTALANDMGFEAVFRRQVEAHGRRGDVAVGISTSGRSPNVLEGLRAARERGLVTVGLTGGGGGSLAGGVDYLIDVPHTSTARIQEVHTMVVHLLCEVVEDALSPP